MTATQIVVLDTSVLAELMKPRPDLAVLRWTNAQPIGTLAVTAVSLAELTYAMLRMSELARTVDLRQALNEFVHDDLASRVLPFDDLAADYFAEYAWKREQAGTPIDVAEAQIAAICRANRVTLATRDPAPYADLGVTTVDPWTAPAPVRVEVPVVVSSPELDRHGKPIPPRRPGAARGGVGPSRPPRQRRPRRSTAKGTPATNGVVPGNAGRAPEPPGDPERGARSKRDAAERLRRHVTAQAAVPEKPTTDGGATKAKRPAPAREDPSARGAGPGRRAARLLGPLVDAEGRAVERTAEGRVRRRSADPSSPTGDGPTPRPDERAAPETPDGKKPRDAPDADR